MATDNTKQLAFLPGVDSIHTPPFSDAARIEAGRLLRRLQNGETIGMPFSRPMPSIGRRCHELRIRDAKANWRVIYRVDATEVVLVEIFAKTTQQTPDHVINLCKARLKTYDQP